MAAGEAEALRRIVLNTKVDVEIDETLPAFMNGSVIGNKMTFNPNGKLDAQSLAIHEFTHIAENAKSYAKLKEAVKNGFLSEAAYTEAVEKKLLEYRTALEEAGRDAESFTKEDAEAEVVAERTQELLGLDERTIARMTQTKPSMVRRVIQTIDDMIHYFKGTAQERQLIEVRRRYVKAVTEGLKSAEKTKAAASIERDAKGRTYVKASRQVITGDTPSQWAKSVENYINEEIRSGRDVQFTATDGDVLTITSDTAGKAKFRNEITMPSGKKRLMTEEEYKAKLRAETHIDELAQVSRRGKKNVPDYKNHSFAKDGFNYRTAYFEDADGQYYEVTISVGQKGEIKTIYNVGKMIKQKEKLSLVAQRPGGKAASENFSNINISKDSSDVNNNMRKDREKDKKNGKKIKNPGREQRSNIVSMQSLHLNMTRGIKRTRGRNLRLAEHRKHLGA